jgi:hypothetical protein
VADAGEGAGRLRKEKEKARLLLTVEDFKIQSMADDKENAGKVANMSGRLPYANVSQSQEEEAAEREEEARITQIYIILLMWTFRCSLRTARISCGKICRIFLQSKIGSDCGYVCICAGIYQICGKPSAHI